MLGGKPTVFLSCSEKFKERVASPVCHALRELGVRAIIVSNEPLLPFTGNDPDSKVEAYLDASDAFVALCTPDDALEEGSKQPRPNVIDEHQRASKKPHLRHKIQVFKEASVDLPSNINPTYEPLELDDPDSVVNRIVGQLNAWGIIGEGAIRDQPADGPSTARLAEPSTAALDDLLNGLELGDHDEASRRALAAVAGGSQADHEALVEMLCERLQDSSDIDTHLVCSLIEAFNRMSPSLVPIAIVEQLADSEDFSKRASAAMLLWDKAEVAPGEVPLGLFSRLAQPASEDWYVQAPAMAAAKLLLLRRRPARVIFESLAASADSDDRYAVAAALAEVAEIDSWAVPRDIAERLANDPDDLVAQKASRVLGLMPKRSEGEKDPWTPFGL